MDKEIRFTSYSAKAEIVSEDGLFSWREWANGNPDKMFPMGVGYDVHNREDLYEVYAVFPDDDAPLGGCTGYIGVPWESGC